MSWADFFMVYQKHLSSTVKLWISLSQRSSKGPDHFMLMTEYGVRRSSFQDVLGQCLGVLGLGLELGV